MRLRWGPHAHQTAEQVVLSDPLYVIELLGAQAGGRLAARFRDLILRFDALPLSCPCVRCRRRADAVCAYPGSLDLIGVCDACTRALRLEPWSSAVRIASYEDAARHVADTSRRDHRGDMRRILRALLSAKGGPARLTEAAAEAVFAAPPGRVQNGHEPEARGTAPAQAAHSGQAPSGVRRPP